MNWYDRHILPHLIDFACGMGEVMKVRSTVVPRAHGRVLEIGIGSGLNLALYDAEKVSAIVGVDPSADMQRLARERAARIDIPVEMIALELGQIQAADASFDSIVCTFTLCTIPDAVAALQEMRRVLKPGGRLWFCEHGRGGGGAGGGGGYRAGPGGGTPGGGGDRNPAMPALIAAGGFNLGELQTGYLKGPKPMTYVYRGWAD